MYVAGYFLADGLDWIEYCRHNAVCLSVCDAVASDITKNFSLGGSSPNPVPRLSSPLPFPPVSRFSPVPFPHAFSPSA